MIALRMFGYECLAQRWEPEARWLDRSRWLFGRGLVGEGGSAFHLGPLHFMACRAVGRRGGRRPAFRPDL